MGSEGDIRQGDAWAVGRWPKAARRPASPAILWTASTQYGDKKEDRRHRRPEKPDVPGLISISPRPITPPDYRRRQASTQRPPTLQGGGGG